MPRPRRKPVQTAAEDVSTFRPPLRPEEPKADDPRARAAKRARELRDHGVGQEDGVDKFFIPSADIPEGWDYQWKRRKTVGAEDPAYEVATARAGWEPVPAHRHPSYMPKGWKGGDIERDGMVLMERPKEISDEARARELRDAREQVRQKEAQLNNAPQGQFPRDTREDTRARVSRNYERAPIPE